MDWIDDLAAIIGGTPLTPDEKTKLLDVARDVAHGVERRITPLSTFLLGMGVQQRIAEGEPRDVALDRAITMLRSALPERPPDRTTG